MRCRLIEKDDDAERLASFLVEVSRSWSLQEKLEMLNATRMDTSVAVRIAGSFDKRTIVVEVNHSTLAGVLSIQHQPWESEIFKRSFYKITHFLCSHEDEESRGDVFDEMLQQIGRLISEKGEFCVVAKVFMSDTAAVEALVDNGFRLVENRLVFEKAPVKNPLLTQVGVRPMIKDDISIISAIAERSFSYSRFHSDVHIPRVLADHSRSEWVKNACEHASRFRLVQGPGFR
jgi:hypothetical protein